MKNICSIFALIFFNSCVYAITCDEQARTCDYKAVFLKDSAVVWSFTAQTTSTPEIEIGYYDSNNKWVLLANSSVHSTNFNNRSTGRFIPPITGIYHIIFHNVKDVSSETAAIEELNKVVVVTHLFAMEDGIDDDIDFDDAFAVVSWFISDSIPLPVTP
ncbi:MAG: hypothetical protein P8Y42_20630 [Exilibacterium sp.]